MATAWDDVLLSQLSSRRERLAAAMKDRNGSERLAALLQQVDAALERFEAGTFGICEKCKGAIEAERIMADPLACTCLDCMTPAQKRALEDDLDLASRIQAQLLPKPVDSRDWEVAFRYQPAGAVSGDYCDLLATEPGGVTFVVGDVSGKGVAASLLMAQLHAIFRTLAPFAPAVEELVRRANRIFCETTLTTHYATLVCGRASGSGEVAICNAGHCPPVIAGSGGAATIEPTGMPLGLFCDSPYSCHRLQLRPGDLLALYTDGITEAEDASEHEYGLERLQRTIARHAAAEPAEIAAACMEDLKSFSGSAVQRDDVTLLVLRRRHGESLN